MAEVLLELRKVEKSFQSGAEQLLILHQLDLHVESGEIVTVVGQSGCGKSTLLNLIGGMDRANSGEIFFRGRDLTRMNERHLSCHRQRQVAMIFQMHHLLKELSALENVMLPALINGQSAANAKQRAQDLLERVGMAGRRQHRPYQLSGGECQRVAVARALINQAPLILADEPTGSLDEKNALVVEELLLELLHDSGLALLLVTHDPRLADRGERCYTLQQGSLVAR